MQAAGVSRSPGWSFSNQIDFESIRQYGFERQPEGVEIARR